MKVLCISTCIYTSIFHHLLLHGQFAEEDCLVLSDTRRLWLASRMSMYHPSAQRMAGIEIEKDAEDHGVKTEDESDDKTTAKLADSDPTKCIVYSNCMDSSCQLPYRSTSEIHRLRNLWSYKWGCKLELTYLTLDSLDIEKYNQFTFAPPSSSHWMNVLRSRSPRVFWRYIFMDGEVDFTQTLVERFTAYHRRSFGVHRFCWNLWKVNSNHDWYKNKNSFWERIFQIAGPSFCVLFFVLANFWGWIYVDITYEPGMLRFVCVQSWLGRRDAGRCRDGGRLQWRGQGVPH